jgi:predicted Zn-dependent protease
MRREMADKKAQPAEPLKVEVQGNQLHAERAGQEFEHGRGLLADGDHDDALPFLARAVHLAPNMASYHAFYGKALSFTENGRHKAEGEMQAAVKLEPNNPVYRMMLAEFFYNVKLMKRAEGELNRLLAIAPDHKEARALLDRLQQK